MEKGINYATQEFKENLAKLINESNLPACVVAMVLNETQIQVNSIAMSAIEQERIAFEKAGEMDGQSIQPN